MTQQQAVNFMNFLPFISGAVYIGMFYFGYAVKVGNVGREQGKPLSKWLAFSAALILSVIGKIIPDSFFESIYSGVESYEALVVRAVIAVAILTVISAQAARAVLCKMSAGKVDMSFSELWKKTKLF